MPTEIELEMLARVIAQQKLLEHIGAMAFLLSGAGPERLQDLRQVADAALGEATFSGVDPAIADHLSDEVRLRFLEMLQEIEEQMKLWPGAPPRPSTR
jgi:hypothetical protein